MFSPMGMSSFFLCESRHLIKTGKEKKPYLAQWESEKRIGEAKHQMMEEGYEV
jgi:hypothetical protein